MLVRVLVAAVAVHVAAVLALVVAIVADAPVRVLVGLAAAVVFTILWAGWLVAERARQAEVRRAAPRAAGPPTPLRPAA